MSQTTQPTPAPQVDDYQQRLINNVRRLIETNWCRPTPNIRVLDMGCDTSGLQLAHLAKLIRGEVVGINIPEDFPSEAAIAAAGDRVTLARMDGTRLDFADNSFDMVISANVMEHVQDPKAYLAEAARVLKPSGLAYVETAPVWSGPRGHHIHDDMIASNCPKETNYRNDGTVIPDWSHLTRSEDEMRRLLADRLRTETIDYVCWYLYQSGDLNKTSWSVISKSLKSHFDHISIFTWEAETVDPDVKPETNNENHDVFGFAATCRKLPANPIVRRLAWRLRRMGL